MLLVSGATPTFGRRLSILSSYLPIWAVESSHFLGTLIGVVFLFLARGLLDRRDGAWRLALAFTIASLGFSLAKGLAYGEVGFLSILGVLLLATRPQFHRPTSMLDQPFTVGWFAAVEIIISAAFGILLLAFHNVDLAPRDLWDLFDFDAQAPRALRALLGASILAIGVGCGTIVACADGDRDGARARRTLSVAAEIIRKQSRSDAMLALMGDKSLIFSESGDSFLMFGKRGRSWIALFDPIGPKTECAELIKRFVTLAHAHGGRAAFYQIPPESLPFYLDAGLTVVKLGEDARVAPGVVPSGGRRLGAFALRAKARRPRWADLRTHPARKRRREMETIDGNLQRVAGGQNGRREGVLGRRLRAAVHRTPMDRHRPSTERTDRVRAV